MKNPTSYIHLWKKFIRLWLMEILRKMRDKFMWENLLTGVGEQCCQSTFSAILVNRTDLSCFFRYIQNYQEEKCIDKTQATNTDNDI